MTSRLIAYAQAVESVFRTHYPNGVDGVQISTHIGEFGEEEIRRYSKKLPAVVLAPLGIPKAQRAGGNSIAEVNWGAFIFARDRPELSRGLAAMALAEVALTFLPFEAFGCAQAPQDVEAGNLYNGDFDKMGLAVWAVRWRQRLELAAKDDCSYATLDDFLRLHAEYQLDPVDDPDDFAAPQTIEVEGPA
jgi:hypothetical protein